MNREQANTLVAVLDERSRITGPDYTNLFGKFSELAVNDLEVERLRHDAQTRASNREMVQELAGLLPTTDPNTSNNAFVVDTAPDARKIQASIIWGYSDPGERGRSSFRIPFYILGSKTIEAGPFEDATYNREILLVSADGNHEPTTARIPGSVLGAVQDRFDEIAVTTYSDEQLGKMFNDSAMGLVLGAFEDDSVVFQLPSPYIGVFRGYVPLAKQRKYEKHRPDPVAHDWFDTLTGKFLLGGPDIRGWRNDNDFEWTDESLALYGVFERMSDLASKFGKTADLRSLILAHTVEQPA